MASKRYYWLKLDEHFFKSNSMKILRRMSDGYRFMIMYIEIMLMAINTEGKLYVSEGVPFDMETLSLVLDMEYELVEKAISVFLKFGMLKKEEDTYVIPDFDSIVGSETADARRKREDKRKSTEIFRNNSTDTEINTEKDIEKDIDSEKETEADEKACGISTQSTPSEKNDFNFIAPEYEEVERYAFQRGEIEMANKFYNHYSAVGWMMGKTPIKDWRAAFRKWEQTEKKAAFDPPKSHNKKEDNSFDTDDFFEAALIKSYGYLPEY